MLIGDQLINSLIDGTEVIKMFEPESKAYFIANNARTIEVSVVRPVDDAYIVRFTNSGGGIRIRANRLYETKEAAEKALDDNVKTALDRKVYKTTNCPIELFHSPHYMGW